MELSQGRSSGNIGQMVSDGTTQIGATRSGLGGNPKTNH